MLLSVRRAAPGAAASPTSTSTTQGIEHAARWSPACSSASLDRACRPTSGGRSRQARGELVELVAVQRLRPVAQRGRRVGVDVDDDRVGAGGDRGARDSGTTRSRLPPECDGSTITGRCDSAWIIGTAAMSRVLRVPVS